MSGIDSKQLRALLRAYIRMSLRAHAARLQNWRGERVGGMSWLLGLYALAGLATTAAAFGSDVFGYAVLLHGMTFCAVGLSLIAESGNMLFDRAEEEVLGAQPIAPRTLLVAKALNLLAYALLLAAALNVFPTFCGLAARGATRWFPAVHVLAVVLLTSFCAALMVLTSAVVARWAGRHAFERFATWAQVAAAVLFVVAFQLLPGVEARGSLFLLALPPAWFAALEEVLAGSGPHVPLLAPALLSVAATGVVGFLALGPLAPGYAAWLATVREGVPRRGTTRWVAPPWLERLWLGDPIERAAFRLAAIYLRRDQEIRLRLYPSLGVFLVFPLLGLVDPRLRDSGFLPAIAVLALATLPAAGLDALRSSSHHAAAEVFLAAPLPGTAPLFHGVRKAALLYLQLPVGVLLLVVFAIAVPDPAGAFRVALPAVLALPTLTLVYGFGGSYLPLALPSATGRQTAANTRRYVVTMLLLCPLIAAAAAADRYGVYAPTIAGEAALLAIAHAALLRAIRRQAVPRG